MQVHTALAAALAEAARSHTPLVLLCGDTRHADRENLQNIDQRAVILASGAGFETLHAPETRPPTSPGRCGGRGPNGGRWR